MMKQMYNQSIKQKYNVLYKRVSKAIQTGRFNSYTAAKKQALYKRLKRYEARLKKWGIAVASATALFLAPMAASGQTPVGSEFLVNTYTTDAQNNPSVAMDSDGDFVIAWQSNGQDGSGWGIYAQRYNSSGVAQGSEFLVNTYTTGFQQNPSVAMDSDGDFVIAWTSYGQDGSGWGIYAQRYNSSGVAQGSEFLVNTYTTGTQGLPSVAMDSDGDFVIAWQSSGQDGDSGGIYAQRYNSSGVAQGSEFLVNTYTTNLQDNSSIAMDSDGDFVIAWQSNGQDGDSYGIYAQRYNSSGVAQGGEFLVNTYTTSAQQSPSVAMDSDGDFAIAWTSNGQDGSITGVYAQRYNSSGVAQGSEFLVNTHTAIHQMNSSIAMDSDGDFTIAWQSLNQDGSLFGVYAQQYNSSGAAQGGEFLVNTYTTSYQYNPSVAMDSDGDLAIAWSSLGQDGDQFGIYAQRYSSAVLPVEMLFFTGEATENGNLLTWATATEENNAGFEVQKSTDGRTFEKITFVEGNGTTLEQQTYEFLDKNISEGVTYYRLKQLDFDGQFEYSKIVNCKLLIDNYQLTIYPNPVQDELTIEDGIGMITIYNALGQPIRQLRNDETLTTVNTAGFPEGVYTLHIQKADGQVVTKQFVK